MRFIDTHTHLYSSQFDADREQAIQRALEAGVSHMILPDVEASSRPAMLSLAEQYPCCSVMVGLHPTTINDNPAWREELEAVEALLRENSARFCAVGEIGLDLYWSRDFEAQQREAFARQIELALEFDMAVAIHCRDAWDALIEELTPFATRGVRGVIHAFTGTLDHYHTLLTLGNFLFGIGGVVTFKKSPLAPVVASMELSHILLETDAPYLTPTPHRGKRNESAYIPLIAAVVAELQAVPLEQVAEVTTANAVRIFGLEKIF